MLLLLPFDRELDWRRPPIAVIGLVLANVFVFLFLQSGDDKKAYQALDYYGQSELPRLEFPAYRKVLTRADRLQDLEAFDAKIEIQADGGVAYDDPQLPYLLEFDPDFRAAIRSKTLIPPGSKDFALWREQRREFQKKLDASVTHRYSLRPAIAEPATLLTHMFLHNGMMHLFGNMLFLFIVGFVVEAALGSSAFLFVYLLAGLSAAGLDLLVQSDDLVYHLGASGAVSGIMGGYAVLFGMRRIHFFYNFLFWFDRVKAPAILMLPLWLANEAWQLSNGESNVNYWAHIAGLVTGGLGIAALRLANRIDQAYVEEPETAENHARELEKALNFMAQLRHADAIPIFRRLLRDDPGNPELLTHLFTASKSTPDSEDFHLSGRALLLGETTLPALRRRVFNDYRTAASRPRLSTAEALGLARRLVDGGAIEEAERLTLAVLERRPDHPGLAPVLKRLVEKAPADRVRHYRQALLRISSGA